MNVEWPRHLLWGRWRRWVGALGMAAAMGFASHQVFACSTADATPAPWTSCGYSCCANSNGSTTSQPSQSSTPVTSTSGTPSNNSQASTANTSTSSAGSASASPASNSQASTSSATYTWRGTGLQSAIKSRINKSTSGFSQKASSGESGGYTYNSCAAKTGGVAAYTSTGESYCTNRNQGCPAGEYDPNNDGVCQSVSGGSYPQWTFSACVNGTQTEYSHNPQTGAVTSTSQVSCVSGSQGSTSTGSNNTTSGGTPPGNSSGGSGGNTTSTSNPAPTTSTGGTSTGGGYTSGYTAPNTCQKPSSRKIHVTHVYTNGTIVTVIGKNLPTLTGPSSVTYGTDYGNFLWSQSNVSSVVSGNAVGNTLPYHPDWGIKVLHSTSSQLQFIPADNNGQSQNPPTGTWNLYLAPANQSIDSNQCATWSGTPGSPPAKTTTTKTVTLAWKVERCMPNPVLHTYHNRPIQPPTNDNWVKSGGAQPNTLLPGPGWAIERAVQEKIQTTCTGTGASKSCTQKIIWHKHQYREVYDPDRCPYPVVVNVPSAN